MSIPITGRSTGGEVMEDWGSVKARLELWGTLGERAQGWNEQIADDIRAVLERVEEQVVLIETLEGRIAAQPKCRAAAARRGWIARREKANG